VGIHIAAPGLAIQPASADATQVGRARLSTVYVPGYKITMLPDDVVQTYTLQRRARLPGRVAVCDAGRSHAGRFTGQRDQARAGAHRPPTCATTSCDAIVTEPWLLDPGFNHDGEPRT